MTRYALDARPVPPVDALVTLGRKGGNGAPVDKDKLWIVSRDLVTREFRSSKGNTFKGEYHPLHPDFEDWHRDATDAERRTLTIEIESATVTDALQVGRARQKDPQGRELDSKVPWCSADHTGQARRWVDRRWQGVPCMRDACQYANGCKPSVTVYGRVVWPGRWSHLPSVRIRLRSRGWDAAKGVMGFVDELDKAWAGQMVHASGRYDLQGKPWHEVRETAGLPDFLATGLQIRLQLFEATKQGGRRRYWGIRVHMVQPMASWLEQQRQRVQLARDLRTKADAPEAPAVIVEPELTGRARIAVDWLEANGIDVADACAWVGGKPAAQWDTADLDTIRGRAKGVLVARGGEE